MAPGQNMIDIIMYLSDFITVSALLARELFCAQGILRPIVYTIVNDIHRLVISNVSVYGDIGSVIILQSSQWNAADLAACPEINSEQRLVDE